MPSVSQIAPRTSSHSPDSAESLRVMAVAVDSGLIVMIARNGASGGTRSVRKISMHLRSSGAVVTALRI